ncbi:MAG: type I secretion system permease/ATPase [Betaproteobacteria bacterium]|nr:type I secretion system permease/ATPase [Betaproteobacteria bacterium]
MNTAVKPTASTELSQLIWRFLPLYKRAALFSFVTSLLVLAPTIFMLEVYDRVVNSRSSTTLVMLIIWVLGTYLIMEWLDVVRSKLMYQASEQFDVSLRKRLFNASFDANLKNPNSGTLQVFNDLRTLRDFIASPAVTAIMDAPSSLLYLIIVFVISPWLGVVALIGAVVQVALGIQTERKTLPALTEANKAAIGAQNYASGVLRNAQVVNAMGMTSHIHQRWMKRQRLFLAKQAEASDTAGINSASAKLIQMLQTSLILGLSCWLTVKGMLLGGGGMMIVASTLGGRVLAPLAQLILQWRLVVNARDSYRRMENFLNALPERQYGMSLPAPEGYLNVEQVTAGAPGSPYPIIRGVNFSVAPGETVAMIGPSAAGKTTLARLLMGIWPTLSGKVRLDGNDMYAWNKAELGPYLGYLPQDVELFDGSIAENIARFGDVDMDQVREAARQVGLDSMIEALPDGYDTLLGEDGARLSGGQRQRVALARAIYGWPKFVLLDEPNSSLDEAGEKSLLETLVELKRRGSTTIIITHRTSVLPAADKILILRDGQLAGFGPRDEVLAALNKARQQQLAASGVPPQVAGGMA